MSNFSRTPVLSVLLCSTALFLAGCTVKPEPIALGKHMERAQLDMDEIYKSIAPLENKLTLSDAIARGLLFNLDHQMIMMERVLQDGQLTLANFNMLPRLAANAGYKSRSDVRASKSIGLKSGTVSLEDSYSEERDVINADLTLSWNLLDFGLSYFQSKQQADRVMTAVERRRKVMNNMVKEVMVSYWKAASAEQHLPQVERLLIEVKGALKTSKKIEDKDLLSPKALLEYRRNLLQVSFQLKQLKGEMAMAKAQLATLINVPPNQKFTLAKPTASAKKLPKIKTKMAELQNYGLVYRPELREEAYQEKIDKQNINKEILRMFPGLSILGSVNHDSNEYLYYQNWGEFTTRATWNLVNLIQGPTAIKNAKMQVEISKMRRLALTAAVLGQVSISYTQYHQSMDNFQTAEQLSHIEQKMLKIAEDQKRANKGTRLEEIQISARYIAAELDQSRALVDAKTALYNLMASVGVDFVPADTETKDLSEMTDIVSNALSQMEEGKIDQWLKLPVVPEAEEVIKKSENRPALIIVDAPYSAG